MQADNKSVLQHLLTRLREFLIPDDNQIPRSAELKLKITNGLKGQDIVTLSTQDWSDLWTRKQRFMLQFARQGNRVMYVETQFHWLTYIKHFKRHWRRIYLFLLGPRPVEDNLFIYTPPLLLPAFQIFPSLARINNFVLGIFLKVAMAKIGVSRPLLWLYSHYNEPLVRMLGCRKALYECVDEFSGAKGLIKPDVVREQERATLRAVDAAIVTAPGLKESKAAYNRNISVVPNAANVRHFSAKKSVSEPDDLKAIPHPRLIFVGGIAYWVDIGLIKYLAQLRPDWQIIMVGPAMVDLQGIDRLQNVHFLGRKPYDDLPDYLASCDIALNPYKIDSVAENCSPLKLYEYMAAGLPVVSTDMPEARKFPMIVRVASAYEDFAARIEEILAWGMELRPWYSAKARAEAQNHSWESRFLEVDRIAREVLC